MTQQINNIAERLKKPTPKVIKKLQKIANIIGGSSVVVTSFATLFPNVDIPAWIPYTILAGMGLNYFLLELFTEDDNK